jgi:predicted enzyme related to lactoylglutathione lyase
MNTLTEPKVHSFCWVELAAKNTDVAKKFYAGLLGWTYVEKEMPEGMGNYIMAMADNAPVGAMFSLAAEAFAGQNIPPHWASYIRVDNCDENLLKAQSLGAKVLKPAFDVMGAGRMATIQDPAGAVINLWEKKGNAGAPVQPMTHGACCWNELLVGDPDAALAFYTKLFGWTAEKSEFDGKTYHSLKHADGTPIGGLMKTPAEIPCPPAWATYFTVTDLKKAMDFVSANGGVVHFGPHEVHGMGHFAACQDPDGAPFSLFKFGI